MCFVSALACHFDGGDQPLADSGQFANSFLATKELGGDANVNVQAQEGVGD